MNKTLEMHRRLSVSNRVTLDTLMLLARDGDFVTRANVSMNPRTPPAALMLLAQDVEVYVRRNVAQHLNTPPDALAALAANDPDGLVRFRASINRRT